MSASAKSGSSRSSGKLKFWIDFAWGRFITLFKILLFAAIVLTVLYIFYFAVPNLQSAAKSEEFMSQHHALHIPIIYTHTATAIPPLLLGMFGFSTAIRTRYPALHRNMGKVYCFCIWFSAILGFGLALTNQKGMIAVVGLSLLGLAWFATTWLAYTAARAKNFIKHRQWMIRSFALTLAVVIIRPLYIFGPGFGLNDHDWYLLLTWACWIPNLVVAEIYIRITKFNGKLIF